MNEKNEHIVYAYAPLQGRPGNVLVIGVTDVGIETLKQKLTLTISHWFGNVAEVVVFLEKDKETLKARLRETGHIITEHH